MAEFTKNKFHSQQIHKHFKNRHRSSKDEFWTKTRANVFDTTDVDLMLRNCKGLSTRDVVTMEFDFDLVYEDDHETEFFPLETPNTFDAKSQESQDEKDSEFSLLDFEWACERCTFVNWPDAVECEMCGAWSWKANWEDELTPSASSSSSTPSTSEFSFAPAWFEPVSNTQQMPKPKSVPVVILDYLTPVRKRASKAQKIQEQIDKEEAAANKKGRRVVPKRKPKKVPRYPPAIVEALPSPTQLAEMRGRQTHVELLPVPDRLQHSVRTATTALRDGKSKSITGLVFHGTDERNTSSIISQGLLVGGSETVCRNGAAYGKGVYCSPNIQTAQCYARGTSAPVFACLVLKTVNKHGNIYVVPQSTQILPVYLLCFGSPYTGAGFSSVPLVAMDQTHNLRIVNAKKIRFGSTLTNPPTRCGIEYEAVMNLLYGRINPCDPTRRSRRKWSKS